MLTLHTPRLILRDYSMEDLPHHHALMSDPAVMYYLPDLYCADEAQSAQNLREAVAQAALPPDARRLWFFRMSLKDGTPLGSIGYTITQSAYEASVACEAPVACETPVACGASQVSGGRHVAEAGYFIHRAHWGRGYTSEAMAEVLRFAFCQGGVHRLTAGCLTENRGSQAVMVRCGMVQEACRPQAVWHDGRFKDRVEYRLLRHEWQALHPAAPEGQCP